MLGRFAIRMERSSDQRSSQHGVSLSRCISSPVRASCVFAAEDEAGLVPRPTPEHGLSAREGTGGIHGVVAQKLAGFEVVDPDRALIVAHHQEQRFVGGYVHRVQVALAHADPGQLAPLLVPGR